MHYTLIQNAGIMNVERRITQDADLVVGHYDNGVAVIEALERKIDPASLAGKTVTRINAKGNRILPSFTDLSVTLREPGAMYKEDIASTCRAAIAGGYHQLLTYFEPDQRYTPTDALQYMTLAFDKAPIGLYPVAGIGRGEGEALFAAGALTLTDRYCPPKTDGALLSAMRRCAEANKTFMASSYEATLTAGDANSGIAAMMGLDPISAVGEELAVIRALLLAKEAGCRIHISGVSTSRALICIAKAKEAGQPVTCDVSLYHFFFDESEVLYHGNTAKLMPPLRGASDREAVIDAIVDGTVDAIASHHAPHDKQDLACSFGEAPFGAIGLELVFAASVEALVSTGRIDAFRLCQLLSLNPHRILREAGAAIPESVPRIVVGEKANFNLVSFDNVTTVSESTLRGRAKNTPLLGSYLQGRVEKAFSSRGQGKLC